MQEPLDNLKNLERKLMSAHATLNNTPQMLDAGPYLASYDILTYENQGTPNPEWREAFDEWYRTREAVIEALLRVLDAGEYSILSYWVDHPDKDQREIAATALIKLYDPRTISALVDQSRLRHSEEIDLLTMIGNQTGAAVLVEFLASYRPAYSLALSASIDKCGLGSSKLERFIYHSYGNIRCAIIAALIAMEEQAVDALVSALDKFQMWPDQLGLVIYTLGMIGSHQAVEPLKKLLSHPNISISTAAGNALLRIQGPDDESR